MFRLALIALASTLFVDAMPAITAAATVPLLETCKMPGKVKPASTLIDCGDGNSSLTKMHWSSWSTAGATGNGMLSWVDCTPNCAAGHEMSHPVTVRLAKPKSLAGGTYFTQLVFVGWILPGSDRVVDVTP